jgi:hypothetical protein
MSSSDAGGRPTSTHLLACLLDLREQVVVRDRARDEDLLLLEADLVLADACVMHRCQRTRAAAAAANACAPSPLSCAFLSTRSIAPEQPPQVIFTSNWYLCSDWAWRGHNRWGTGAADTVGAPW